MVGHTVDAAQVAVLLFEQSPYISVEVFGRKGVDGGQASCRAEYDMME